MSDDNYGSDLEIHSFVEIDPKNVDHEMLEQTNKPPKAPRRRSAIAANRPGFVRRCAGGTCTTIQKSFWVLGALAGFLALFLGVILLNSDQESAQTAYRLQKELYDDERDDHPVVAFIKEEYGDRYNEFEIAYNLARRKSKFTFDMIKNQQAEVTSGMPEAEIMPNEAE